MKARENIYFSTWCKMHKKSIFELFDSRAEGVLGKTEWKDVRLDQVRNKEDAKTIVAYLSEN